MTTNKQTLSPIGLTVGSLFAGIGGICLGFKGAGCNVVWSNEFDKHACMTYRHNNPSTRLLEADVKTVDPLMLGQVDILTSGFPCQAFSLAGLQKGFEDPRGNLFQETVRFIKALKPKAFLLENVKNLKSHNRGETYKVICKELNAAGYSCIHAILNAKDFGNIPQARERIYIVGFIGESECTKFINNIWDNEDVNDPARLSCSCRFKFPKRIPLTVSVRDLLETGRQDDKYYYCPGQTYYDRLKEAVIKPNVVYQWRRVYARENKSGLCPTLTANMGGGGHNVPIILDEYGIRKLTPSECLKLQGFPSSFTFPKGMADSHCYKQAGNSVVVPVITRIANSMIKAIKKV